MEKNKNTKPSCNPHGNFTLSYSSGGGTSTITAYRNEMDQLVQLKDKQVFHLMNCYHELITANNEDWEKGRGTIKVINGRIVSTTYTRELARFFEEAETSTLTMVSNAQLILDTPTEDQNATFECDCCGTFFQGNVKMQLGYDKDAGYGICPDCERYY
jgi:Zn finger protein HypA/HybF involved in hydrogenase expression